MVWKGWIIYKIILQKLSYLIVSCWYWNSVLTAIKVKHFSSSIWMVGVCSTLHFKHDNKDKFDLK